MKIEQNILLLEAILAEWKSVIDKDFEGYKNHVYRMLNFCFFLHDTTEEEKQKLIISACFHDLGLWSDETVDYLPPSIGLAKQYLKINKLEYWLAEIVLMIDMHHKLTEFKSSDFPLVEVFRKADLADFSLGLVKGGVSADYISEVKAAFPNAGFHKMLCKEQGKWLLKHPLTPFPILRW